MAWIAFQVFFRMKGLKKCLKWSRSLQLTLDNGWHPWAVCLLKQTGVGAQVARLSFDMVGMNGDISAVELEHKMYMELIRNAKHR